MIVCWSVKGGSGTTVVASTLALVHAAQSSRGALIVDLAGDVPAVLGLAEPTGIGASEWLAQPEKSARMSLQSIAIQATANLQMISRGAVSINSSRFDEFCASLQTFDLPIIIDAGCGVPDESAQQIAISTVEQTVNLNDVEVTIKLDSRIAKVDLRFSREVAVPIIGRLFKRVELRASAVMPRQLATN